MDQAWAVAMAPGGSQSVVDLAEGGFAVPRHPSGRGKKIAPPNRKVPIEAQVPSGRVMILPFPGHFGYWMVVRNDVRGIVVHK
jgi:hypothetical protein